MQSSIGRQTVESFMKLDMEIKPIFAQFLSDHGREMTVSPAHIGNPYIGKAKHCYSNSARVALDLSVSGVHDELFYCEGFAATKTLGFPIEHAWLCDRYGRVVDPTWREAGIDYFGVAFTVDFLREHMLHTKHFGVLCNLYLLPDDLRGHGACLQYLEAGILELDCAHANA